MSGKSKIEWTDVTWNPVRGCLKISPGCKNCYAETFAERFRGIPGHPYEQGFDFRLVPEKLCDPLRWTKPKTVFVNSMSDLFQDAVQDEYIVTVARVMDMANWHTYQVLTKRAERLREMLTTQLRFAAHAPHIWWGVSVEDKQYGLPRIEHLRATPAQVRFLSIEPLLEDLGPINLQGIHWVIVGGESGPGARPMEKDWAETIRGQCESVGVPFFFKQWGGVQKDWAETIRGQCESVGVPFFFKQWGGVQKKSRLLDGRTYDERPTRISAAIPNTAQRRALLAKVERKQPLTGLLADISGM